MRVFLDGRTPYGGIGRHVRWLQRELAKRLGPDLVLLGASEESPGTAPAPSRRLIRAGAGALKRIALDQRIIPRRVASSGADLFHSPHSLVPRGVRVPTVASCYDLTLLDHFETKKRGPMKYYERQAWLGAIQRARFVLTPSEAVRRELVERFKLDPERTLAIPPTPAELPVAADENRLPPQARGPFFLTVGTLEPRKNLSRLLDAHEKVWRKVSVPLLLAGTYGWRQRAVTRRVRNSSGAVHWLGWVPDEVLGDLYRRAAAVVQVSLAEGFDLPVLEALNAGAPLVLSDLAVHREVAGDLAVYAPAHDAAAIASLMETVLEWDEERRASHAPKSWERAREKTSDATIESYLAVYRRVLSG